MWTLLVELTHMMASVLVVLVLVLVVIIVSVLMISECCCQNDEAARRRCSLGPMGLRGKGCCRRGSTRRSGGRRPHGVLDVRPFSGAAAGGLDAYISSLGRGPRRTMLKQVDATFCAKGIVHEYRPVAAHALGWEHLAVCIAHQRRQFRKCLPLGVILGLGRFLVARCMTGGLDEFRVRIPGDGDSRRSLVAWSQPIAKGKTLRGMWYYCLPEHDRSCIWFFTVRLNVGRALRAGLFHVDAGPSDNSSVAALKEKYGFQIDERWHETVSYEGDFVELLQVGSDGSSCDDCGAREGQVVEDYQSPQKDTTVSGVGNQGKDTKKER